MQLADLTWCFPLAVSYPPHPFLLVQESVSPFQTGVAFLSVDAPKTGNLYVLFSELFLGLPFLNCLQHRRVHMLESLFWGGIFLSPSLPWFFLHWDRLLKS